MTSRSTTALSKLSESAHILSDPAEDIRGRKVRDPDGEDLGKIDDLLVDSEHGKVRFLWIEHGGILGFGATPSFMPVEAITRITDDTVHVDESRDRVSGAPRYDPKTIDGSELFEKLFGYYGYLPK